MIGILFTVAMAYIATGVATYLYCVIKSYQFLGFWSFKIDERHVGICVYPRWLMAWMHWAAVKVNELKR